MSGKDGYEDEGSDDLFEARVDMALSVLFAVDDWTGPIAIPAEMKAAVTSQQAPPAIEKATPADIARLAAEQAAKETATNAPVAVPSNPVVAAVAAKDVGAPTKPGESTMYTGGDFDVKEGQSVALTDAHPRLGAADVTKLLGSDELARFFPMKVLQVADRRSVLTGKKLDLKPGETISFTRPPDSAVEEEGIPSSGASKLKRLTWRLVPSPRFTTPGAVSFVLIAHVDGVRPVNDGEDPVFESENVGYVGEPITAGQTKATSFRVVNEPDNVGAVASLVNVVDEEPGLTSNGTIWPWWDAPIEAAINELMK